MASPFAKSRLHYQHYCNTEHQKLINIDFPNYGIFSVPDKLDRGLS